MSKKARYKRWLRLQREGEEDTPEVKQEVHPEKIEKVPGLKGVYQHHYKLLLLIPLLLLIASIFQIGYQYGTTGDFLHRAVSLKGGVTLTVPIQQEVSVSSFRAFLQDGMPDVDFFVRSLTRAGTTTGIIIDADLEIADEASTQKLIRLVSEKLDMNLQEGDYTTESTGASLGASFFRETAFALLFAYLFMGLVVYYYFRTPTPSIAVILAAFSDMVITLAIVNVLDMRLTTAGIAAFLMLIGYSVDTDILLSTKVLKRKEGSVLDRVYSAMRTGMTMSVTTLVAVTVALFFTESEVIKQIMTIIIIGLVVDLINTWIQNAGILRWYLEKKQGKEEIHVQT